MTFDDWLHHRFPAGVDGYANMLNIQDLKQAWNAALEAAQKALDQRDFYGCAFDVDYFTICPDVAYLKSS